MPGTLAITALLMGLAGGPHCVAMCGAACSGVVRLVRAGDRPAPAAYWRFHAGRLVGYSLAGAAAAQATQGLAWLTAQTGALRPIWTLFHLAVLMWGLTLLVLARQPAWASHAGRVAWSRLRPSARPRNAEIVVGALWAFMPCGLLYSALLVASLSGEPLDGALSMALFAVGTTISLVLAPKLFGRFQRVGNRLRQDWGTRACGVLLVLTAAWALWRDLAVRIAVWCGLA
jgi:uncharacterized protein